MSVLALSIWLVLDDTVILMSKDDNYLSGTYILLIAGSLMTIIGFLGCCGALRESQCRLGTVNSNYSILNCKTVETAFENIHFVNIVNIL